VVVREGQLLLVRRAQPPAVGPFTLPGGAVETGESLTQAVQREVREETGLVIDPVGLVGHREVIIRDTAGGIERHFVILVFAARWRSGELAINTEIAEARWVDPPGLTALPTTEGLAGVVAAALDRLA
jgi:ADP-ribose pyrophosphatase YjhB (NUDIX family)